jgi:hypothetical protein
MPSESPEFVIHVRLMYGANGFCASGAYPGVMTVDSTWMKRPSTGVILGVKALTADRYIVQLGIACGKGKNESTTYSTRFAWLDTQGITAVTIISDVQKGLLSTVPRGKRRAVVYERYAAQNLNNKFGRALLWQYIRSGSPEEFDDKLKKLNDMPEVTPAVFDWKEAVAVVHAVQG